MCARDCCSCCYTQVKNGISAVFGRYGEFVAKYPHIFIVVNIVVFGGLGVGLLKMKSESSIEKIYFPKNSIALDDREFVRSTFPNINSYAYNAFSQSEADNSVSIIFKCKTSSQSIFDTDVTADISAVVNTVKTYINSSTTGKMYSDLCAKASARCVVDGEFALDTAGFQAAVAAGNVTYPYWNQQILATSISGVKVNGYGILTSATVMKVSFKLAETDQGFLDTFLAYMHDLKPNRTDVAYSTPESLEQELDKSTKGDVVYFSLTITLVCIYASLVSSGGDPVSTRGALAFGGILAAGLGIVGSMGLLCLCGVEFVNMVGVVPFLIIGIGVDDMFLLMSSYSENLPSKPEEQKKEHVPKLLRNTLASAGIGITITSLTDFFAFFIGSFSTFRSVTNFSYYAGLAVLFCYIANASLFSACLALHGRRVYDSKHHVTCRKTRPKKELEDEGKSCCFVRLCGGEIPKGPRDDESVCEMLPGTFLPRLFRYTVVNVIIIIAFCGYLAASIYGATQLKQGLLLQNLVLDSSYYHTFLTQSDQYFPARIPVSFVVKETQDYAGTAGTQLSDLLTQAQQDKNIDSSFRKCWLESYKNSSFYNPSQFIPNLQTFLGYMPDFRGDVVFDTTNSSIIASRCFIMTKPTTDQYANADMMKRMREVASNSSLPAIAYHSAFVAFEQFLAVLPATIQLVGIAVAVMTVVTFLLLPHPLMVLLVVLTIVMILIGIFGFMYYWDLTLSSITMIHLVMSVGFSVDFSAHVCAAYLMSDAVQRKDRAGDAIRHAAAPILNGATSTLLGVLLLLASSSYIFQSFFKVMVLVIGFGLIHAVFFLPAVLSLLGPVNKVGDSGDSKDEGGTATVHGNGTSVHNDDVEVLVTSSSHKKNKLRDETAKMGEEAERTAAAAGYDLDHIKAFVKKLHDPLLSNVKDTSRNNRVLPENMDRDCPYILNTDDFFLHQKNADTAHWIAKCDPTLVLPGRPLAEHDQAEQAINDLQNVLNIMRHHLNKRRSPCSSTAHSDHVTKL